MIISFGPWRPDQPILGNACIEAKNVIPRAGFKAPLKALAVSVNSALDGECRGAFSVKGPTGDVYTYAGTDTSLYSILSTSISDVSRGEAYTGNDINHWNFVQFGNYVIAANGANPIQYTTIGGTFDDLTNAPIAKYICVIKDYVLAAYVNDDSRLTKWCATNDITGWTAAVDSSGEQICNEAGIITGIVGGDPAFVFCEYGIYRVQWVGGNVVFQYDRIENANGCMIPGSLTTIGRTSFYWSPDGFRAFDGALNIPIGDGVVDQYFSDDLQANYRYRVYSASDPVNNIVMWVYPGSGSSGGVPNKALIYNYKINEWSRGVFDSQIVFNAYSADTSLEEVSALFADLESVTPSLDSPTWRGGDVYLGAFDTSNKLSDFSGSALEAIVGTGDIQLGGGRVVFLSGVRPLVDVSTATVRVGRKISLSDSISYTSATAMQTSGRVPVRARGAYHRLEQTVPAAASWTSMEGFSIDQDDISLAGKR